MDTCLVADISAKAQTFPIQCVSYLLLVYGLYYVDKVHNFNIQDVQSFYHEGMLTSNTFFLFVMGIVQIAFCELFALAVSEPLSS
jgi:hypothetical protein